MSPRPVSSTYRLQLTGDGTTFADAIALVDYLEALGVSHVYLSPVLSAAAGSTHGYDVVDPTTVSAALGGRAGLEALAREVRSRGMGLLIDIVPNHVGVGDPCENPWWWDVLRHGRDSRYATYFDVDWAADNGTDGRIALPVLGSAADVEELTVDRTGDEPTLAYYERRFPVAPGTDAGTGAEVHARQAYRLVPWDSGLIGYRRFFTVDDLAAVRVEDPAVFDAVHAQVASWMDDDLTDGVRVDHPDGLADPTGYLRRLRGLVGPDRWLVIEKILGDGEPLDPTLPVDGTTGYDALGEVGAVFLDPRGEKDLNALSLDRTGTPGDAEWLHAQEKQIKRAVLQTGLAPEVRRLVRAVRRDAADATCPDERLRDAVIAVAAELPVYRSDYASLGGMLPRILGDRARADVALEPALEVLARALARGGEAAARFGQVCGAATAKAVEDCLFYRAARLVSLQEVGGHPGRFGLPVAEFHLAWAERARRWPRAMTSLSTHDTKRGEDVRARIGVLSQVPQLWAACLSEWESVAPPPDAATGLFLWQNLFGAWPRDGVVTGELRSRLREYARKALRENGLRTTWTEVDEEFEGAVAAWLDAVCDGPVGASLTEFVSSLTPHFSADSLGQKLLQLLGPGIPDVYQGTELWEDSLVDPDNRRPVDFATRRRLLAQDAPPAVDDAGTAKLAVVRRALRLRRERPASFVGGAYVPLSASGPAAGHLIGFGRGPAAEEVDVVALASRHTVTLEETGWGDTTLDLPPGLWVDRLTGRRLSGTVSPAEVFADLPVAALARD
ncbi:MULTISPECIES: malto-oligosyltrehalose synthase [Rhodococcus]|uniref:malto-oligosyltrehalose synthase n=1 Tax=Rhodococcus TaxID=1827 RepID=UPI0003A80EA4|nr:MULTISPECIES: malto-oligosyltrehalose synthase [Rhodococcus]MBC2587909.1 malto-oligosyltrehalose synthase [Rhodococcus aetherivorans]QRI74060.1 malto-oligosyltrehalose synthase [Rhodococcus aetherivorans]QSE57469.1 malto-oligosyltrehalose synthase [Rhodococcus sp. PSBB066]QSE71196.1 malto-oligosyltrehalose synthase [Rhodococcus sp. PSBB049]